MAAQTSYTPAEMSNPDIIVSPHFLAPYLVDLTITRKVASLSLGNFSVTDVNGNVVFKVKAKKFSLHDRRSLLDAADNPILSFRKKVQSAHNKWVVFKGLNDIIFTTKLSTSMQLKKSLDVFLGCNDKDVCDYKVKGGWHDRSCTIYAGESTTVVAQMDQKHTVQNVALVKDTCIVTVYPNVDHAFIVALIVILHEINEEIQAASQMLSMMLMI
uniref:Protein LURP-one-related 15 n=1 Tax=Tanacetum cinerariifolium TaxID=118510 RepID=A0A699H7A0_TANCI|nr:protein LURP-one-related 15 [Tanacetum cinerariifolium]